MSLLRTQRRAVTAAAVVATVVGAAGLALPATRTIARTAPGRLPADADGSGDAPPGSGTSVPPATTAPGPADGAVPPALENAVDQLVADGVPGVQLRLRHGDKVTSVVAGKGDTKTGAAPKAGDRFRIGSQTKTFIATVVLQLVGEGKLKLDDTVERWLPGVVPNGKGITVRQLLDHTSGLYDYLNDAGADLRKVPALAPYFDKGDWTHVWQPTQLVALATAQKPIAAPGQAWHYSNSNYLLAGLIVEKVTGNPLVAEVGSRIVTKLGLGSTSFPVTEAAIPGDHLHGYAVNVPPGYRITSGFDITTFSPSVFWAAAGMISTTQDLETFYTALMGGKLLPTAQQAELKKTVHVEDVYDYGLGVYQLPLPCGSAWGHDGSVPGYTTQTLVSSDGTRQLSFVLNSNWRVSEKVYADFEAVAGTALCGDQKPTTVNRSPDLDAVQRATDRSEPSDDSDPRQPAGPDPLTGTPGGDPGPAGPGEGVEPREPGGAMTPGKTMTPSEPPATAEPAEPGAPAPPDDRSPAEPTDPDGPQGQVQPARR